MVEAATAGREAAARTVLRAAGASWAVWVAVSVPVLAAFRPGLVAATAAAVPAVLLALAFLVALTATQPARVAFDPADPAGIELAHWRAAGATKRRVAWAQTLLALGALGVGAALVALAVPFPL
ncbi:hypothetical protein [Cellulomonas marina]|uniref:Uncharacterized protein n=1 Tax=Cellulomonas marina TaxID=988821 RepID=A0A1I0ZHJ6_9CELL|nr:hypothetical protein [Cellulomonas marina]GIG28546.1 hypothetical protein Cma02nite_11460 [Cellulomonas marina]SFB24596.1 hypothetical protein SAMN05421867_11133 [Cellulomonas marina]